MTNMRYDHYYNFHCSHCIMSMSINYQQQVPWLRHDMEHKLSWHRWSWWKWEISELRWRCCIYWPSRAWRREGFPHGCPLDGEGLVIWGDLVGGALLWQTGACVQNQIDSTWKEMMRWIIDDMYQTPLSPFSKLYLGQAGWYGRTMHGGVKKVRPIWDNNNNNDKVRRNQKSLPVWGSHMFLLLLCNWKSGKDTFCVSKNSMHIYKNYKKRIGASGQF